MHQAQDIFSLTDFKQNTKEHLDRLHDSGRAEVLTVNGKAEAVVMAPQTYDKLVELALGDVRAKIALGLDQARAGQLLDGGGALEARRGSRVERNQG